MKINVFIGVVGSGKDYAARQIDGAIKIAFADKLREMVWRLVGWRPKNDDDYDRFKKMVFKCDEVSFTGRNVLERVGTEIVRDIDENYWVDEVEGTIFTKQQQGEKIICITDARFPNEIERLFQIGIFHKREDMSVDFTFCDYHSKRYDPNRDHDCEKMAQAFLKAGFKHGDSLNEIIYSGKWKDFLNT